MTTSTTRKAAERQRKREAGLVPLEVWIHHTKKKELKEVIARMNREVKE